MVSILTLDSDFVNDFRESLTDVFLPQDRLAELRFYEVSPRGFEVRHPQSPIVPGLLVLPYTYVGTVKYRTLAVITITTARVISAKDAVFAPKLVYVVHRLSDIAEFKNGAPYFDVECATFNNEKGYVPEILTSCPKITQLNDVFERIAFYRWLAEDISLMSKEN
jgi:hypothetical protein